ncbi:hypothetical protein VCHA50O413_20223 [Vibrio chagasii]|nr:hypothetical protein VCHA28FP16_120106 [Vibrio chagasii]CAH6990360.1 hypothetical protein VCHA50O405_10222 [Vibrio chagasii]CAH7021939.1 hypothetical protein VCHA36P168_60042 [Vibrio chagasii]CAH7038670.1 hypothetical protein VCHA34P114_70223 [Vibrio chagasii]CAH7077734.1 hypothetical protein VCHA50O402_20224 [Vibrio chagasii]
MPIFTVTSACKYGIRTNRHTYDQNFSPETHDLPLLMVFSIESIDELYNELRYTGH